MVQWVVGAITMNMLSRACCDTAFSVWYSCRATFGPMETSYQEFTISTGAENRSPSPPKSVSAHAGSFGRRFTNWSIVPGGASIRSMMVLSGRVQMSESIPEGGVRLGVRFQKRLSRSIVSRGRSGGKIGRYRYPAP